MVFGGKYNISVMADPETNSYDGNILGNILVLGSSASDKTTLVQEMASNSMFGKLEGAHWVSAVELSKSREAKIDSCFKPKVEFYNPQDEYDLKKSFCRLRKSLRRKTRKVKNCCREHWEWRRGIRGKGLLYSVGRCHWSSRQVSSFHKVLIACRKSGYNVLYIFHESELSSAQWNDILSQKQMFSVFLSAMDLALNHLVKFITRSPNVKGYVGRQQLWLTNFVQTLAKKSDYTCFCLDKSSNVFGAARYRSQVENPETQYCYLNSSV